MVWQHVQEMIPSCEPALRARLTASLKTGILSGPTGSENVQRIADVNSMPIDQVKVIPPMIAGNELRRPANSSSATTAEMGVEILGT